ncbi:MAG: type II secretion system GspH family protein [Proteobacteria bacterium]|nr:type II secretion system GspH family protein [Pseudomonadota bacterium]
MKNFRSAFSLIEMSVVLAVIGLLVAGVAQTSKMIDKAKIASAQSQTKQSVVKDMPGLALWYESTLESSFIPEEVVDGGEISTWYDGNVQALSRVDATQATSGNKPIYTQNIINGLPALKFGGTKIINVANTEINPCAQSFTVFAVFKTATVTTNGVFDGWQILFSDASNLANDIIPMIVTGTYISTANGGPSDRSMSASTKVVTDNNPHLAVISRNMDTGSRNIWIDGSNNASDSNGAQGIVLNANPILSIGRSANNNINYIGYIGEIIIFNRQMLTDERKSVEKYLSKKWGIDF